MMYVFVSGVCGSVYVCVAGVCTYIFMYNVGICVELKGGRVVVHVVSVIGVKCVCVCCSRAARLFGKV